MQYKIVVDKQPMTNPSSEKKEYIIDIEELRAKGNIHDSLMFEIDKTYVIRRLKLSEYYVLSVLEEPITEALESVDIKLFEGDNYIYLIDMTGNKFYAEYLIKNEFNDVFATRKEMNTAIDLTMNQITMAVNEKFTDYSTTEEMNSAIDLKADEINAEVEKKVDEETITGAYLILKINGDTSEAKLNADKIELLANDILNLLAGNTINLTGKNIAISSTNFNVDKNGNMTCKNAKINAYGGSNTGDSSGLNLKVSGGSEYEYSGLAPGFGVIRKGLYNYINFQVEDSVSYMQIICGDGNYITNTVESDITSTMWHSSSSYSQVADWGIITPKIMINNWTSIAHSSSELFFGTGSEYSGVTSNLRGNTVRIYSHSSGAVYLGYSGSTAITSDENLKDISDIDNKYIEFFKKIKPITYIYKDRGHRTHMGFGARQVEDALIKSGLTTEQFAGILIDKDVTISADEAGTEEDMHYDELYSLRYEEFIALNTMIIQKQFEEIEKLMKRVEKLEVK